MSDDEADPELLELLRQSLGISSKRSDEVSSDTGVLSDAEYIYNNAIDVAVDMYGTKAAAASIYQAMQERSYSTQAWSQHDLHPSSDQGFSDVDMVNFIFTMDLLNFSFWSNLPESDRYQVEYQDKRWTGYQSLVACLRRALVAGIPITTPRYWRSRHTTDEALRHVFRSATEEKMPLINERIALLREAAQVLHESFGDPDEPDGVDDIDDAAQIEDSKQDEAATAAPVEVSKLAEAGAGHADRDAQVEYAEGQADLAITEVQVSNAEVSGAIETVENLDVTISGATVPDQSIAPTEPKPPEDAVVQQSPDHAPSRPDLSVIRLIRKADHSAGKLVNLLAKHFSCFRDEARFDGRKVRLQKRAQIFVADLWAAFNGTGYGEFHDIAHLTMFADYRVPQMLNSLGVLSYSPALTYRIRDQKEIPPGSSWEAQLRGCSIWAVERIRREIIANHPEAEVNAVLIDFFLYDLAKEREAVQSRLGLPHHRTRSVWY